MARNRFVEPAVVRLYLVDVHRRAYSALERKIAETKDRKELKTLTEEFALFPARIETAEKEGDWIDVKKELTAGEARRVFTSLVKTMHAGEKAELDPEQVGKSRVVEYVVGWSFLDPADKEGKRMMPFSSSALDNLDQDTYIEISAAVDYHDETVEKARAERKNGQGTSTAS